MTGLLRLYAPVWFARLWPAPGPGSVVSVPARDPTDRFDTRGLITDLVGILGSLTTVIVVLTR